MRYNWMVSKGTLLQLSAMLLTVATAFVSCHSNKNNKAAMDTDTVKTITPVAHDSCTVVDSTDSSLVIYTPQYRNIDLVCGTMPSVTDSDVIFFAEAAYTGETLDEFKHSNIAGDHVSSGRRYVGYTCKRNTGAFVYYNGKYKFLYKEYSNELDSAAKYGGMGFGQEMLIHKGRLVPCKRSDNNENEFRALCEFKNRVCVIDSKRVVEFKTFKDDLLKIGVTEALYLDMGPGWNHSWWRDKEGNVRVIHLKTHNFTTNWITFYK